MSTVILDVSMSLDGFTAGPDTSAEHPLGRDGERLHEWMAVDREVRREVDEMVGAALVGARTFAVGLAPWGGTPWAGVPSFVVTHRTRPDLRAGNGGTFVFDGLDGALRRAIDAAGDKAVVVLGAEVGRQLLAAGLVDELRLHLAPVLLGRGARLFAGEPVGVERVGEPRFGAATHLRYRVTSRPGHARSER